MYHTKKKRQLIFEYERMKKMNQTIHILTEHRSYRNFKKNQQLPTEHLSAILNGAKQAPSFENGQFYSIVRLTDKTIREKLVTINPNNPQLADCSEALLFIADLKRTQIISEKTIKITM